MNGQMPVEAAVDMIVVNDVFLHTWDLARATGLDENLDSEIASEMLAGMEPYDEMLRSSGHYGPRVEVADDADAQPMRRRSCWPSSAVSRSRRG